MLRPTFSVAARGPPPPKPGVSACRSNRDDARTPNPQQSTKNNQSNSRKKNIDILRMVPHHRRRLDLPLQLPDTIQRKVKLNYKWLNHPNLMYKIYKPSCFFSIWQWWKCALSQIMCCYFYIFSNTVCLPIIKLSILINIPLTTDFFLCEIY